MAIKITNQNFKQEVLGSFTVAQNISKPKKKSLARQTIDNIKEQFNNLDKETQNEQTN